MPKTKMPHPWFSWSQVDMWHKCPAMYEARYYKKKKPLRTYDMRLGSAGHKAAQAIGNAAMKGIELGYDDAKVVARAAVKQEMVAGEILPGDWGQLVHGLTAWAKEVFFRRKQLHGTEVECRIPYSTDHKVELLIKLDAVFLMGDDGMEIVDLKNSRKIWRKDYLMDDRQLPVYCLGMLERVPGLRTIRAGHWYLRHRSYNMIDMDPEQVGHVREWIDQALEGITSGRFPARVNRECGRCPLRGSCKTYAARYKGIKGGRPKDALDADRRIDVLSKTINLLELEKDDLRSYIGDRCDEQDQILVDAGSQAWYHRVEDRRIIPARQTIDLYSEHGVELLDHLTVKTTELDKVTKGLIRGLPSKMAQDKFLKQLEKIETKKKITKLVRGKPLPVTKPTKPHHKKRKKSLDTVKR